MNDSGKYTLLLVVVIALLSTAVVMQGTAIHRLNSQLDKAATAKATSPKQEYADSAKTPVTPSAPTAKAGKDTEDWPLPRLNIDDWDPFKEMERMNEQMDRMFDDAFGHFKASPRFNKLFKDKEHSPSFDITDNGDHYTVTVDTPGIDKSKLEVNVNGQTLTVSGTTDTNTEQKEKGRIVRQERRSGIFKRSITLPEPVKADEVKTETKNGVLQIEIPKEKKETAPQK